MKSHVLALLVLGGNVLAQDISKAPTDPVASSQALATSFGTIDQPSMSATESTPSQAAQSSQPSAITQASAPLQPSAPLSPGLPSSPTPPLSALAPQQPSQISQTTVPTDPLPPTPSAAPPTPLIVSSVDGSPLPTQSSAQILATRTFEAMQNLSNSLNNLVKVKSY